MRYIFYSHFTKKLAFKSTTILMPFRKKSKLDTLVSIGKQKKFKNKHVGGKQMGQENLI